MSVLRKIRAGFTVGRQDFTNLWTPASWLFGWLLGILTSALTWILLGRMTGSVEREHYLLVGAAVMAGPQAVSWAISAGSWDRFDGTFPLHVISPAGLAPALIGRTCVWCLNGIVTSIVTLIPFALLFRLDVTVADILLMVPMLALTCVSCFCFMLFVGALASWKPPTRNAVGGALLMIMAAICGGAVPVAYWPAWVQVIANGIPVTHGLAAIRLLMAHGPPGPILAAIGLELAVGSAWLAVSLFSIRQFAESGRASGLIDYT